MKSRVIATGRAMLFALSLCGTLLAGTAATPEDTLTDPPPMAAAGVLERNGKTDCSAVLIAPDLIASVAHCLAGLRLASVGGGGRVVFRTGAYAGHPSVDREVVAIAAHPLYQASRLAGGNSTGADVALARLAEPVPEHVASPIPLGAPLVTGDTPLVASWPGGQGERARERRCPVLLDGPATATLSCRVIPGDSGGAVVHLTDDGPRLAGLVVAKGARGNQPFAFVVQAPSRIRQIQALYGF